MRARTTNDSIICTTRPCRQRRKQRAQVGEFDAEPGREAGRFSRLAVRASAVKYATGPMGLSTEFYIQTTRYWVPDFGSSQHVAQGANTREFANPLRFWRLGGRSVADATLGAAEREGENG